jgi:hypothetical protein
MNNNKVADLEEDKVGVKDLATSNKNVNGVVLHYTHY